jgi:hypothetical protein
MFNINKYLEKFSKNISGVEIQKNQILEIINKYIKLEVLPQDIEIKNYIVYIKSSPSLKNQIFIYKNKILKDIVSSLPNLKIGDIK